MMASQSLTSHLLSLNQDQFTRATQAPFLAQAASGTLPKDLISHWLANDRLYMQGYIRLTGALLRITRLPSKPTASKSPGSVDLRLVDWLVDALVNIRREERFFMDVAERYELEVDLTESDGERIKEERKIEGLKKYETLFNSLTTNEPSESVLPWLEGVVLFWATEKVYFDAWSWAKKQAEGTAQKSYELDADRGAMRKDFIPNWTNDEFISFVNTLQSILDEGVQEVVGRDPSLKKVIEDRAEQIWWQVLDAEEAFWPCIA